MFRTHEKIIFKMFFFFKRAFCEGWLWSIVYNVCRSKMNLWNMKRIWNQMNMELSNLHNAENVNCHWYGVRCTDFPVSAFNWLYTLFCNINSTDIENANEVKKKIYRNFQHPCHMLIQFNVYRTCIIVASIENQLKNILAKGIVSNKNVWILILLPIDMNFPSKNVFIISSFVIGSFMAHSKILLFTFLPILPLHMSLFSLLNKFENRMHLGP